MTWDGKIKTMFLSDQFFLRIDKKDIKVDSFLQKNLTELSIKNPINSFFWKLILSPLYLLHSFRAPKLELKGVNSEIRVLRINKMVDAFCIRTRFLFVFDSLARVIILDEKRINKRGQRFQILRNEINKAKKLMYTTEVFQGELAMEILDSFYLMGRGRNWRNQSRYIFGKHDCKLFVCAGFNMNKDIIAVNATLVSHSYAYMFFYSGLEKRNIRWMITERMIEYAFSQGVTIFHTDNLLDVSTGSYVFQKAMGYQTVRLRFK
jgi:hypothetical protein